MLPMRLAAYGVSKDVPGQQYRPRSPRPEERQIKKVTALEYPIAAHHIERVEAVLEAPASTLTKAAIGGRAVAAEAVPTQILTFKYRLLPSKAQHARLRAALDHTRDLYNCALEGRIAAYRKAGKAIGFMAQCRELTELRADAAYAEFAVSMQRWPLKKLDLAFQAFFRRFKSGDKPGFPRFKGRDWFKTFGFGDSDGWKVDGSRLCMKGIGRVRIHLHRAMPSKPFSCQIKRDSKGWIALLACKAPIEVLPANGKSIGLDLGITSFIATSDGSTIPGFYAARRAQKEMRRRQRSFARCKQGSNNRRKAKDRVASLHECTVNARRTFHHQIAAKLVRENDLIAIENLNIKGLAGGMLAREVHDAGWSQFTQLLIEKAERAGRLVVKVDPNYTSQTCPSCGQIAKKKLSQRTHQCDCGCVLDRDVAAAMVILNRVGNHPGAGNEAGCGKRSPRNMQEAA